MKTFIIMKTLEHLEKFKLLNPAAIIGGLDEDGIANQMRPRTGD